MLTSAEFQNFAILQMLFTGLSKLLTFAKSLDWKRQVMNINEPGYSKHRRQTQISVKKDEM